MWILPDGGRTAPREGRAAEAADCAMELLLLQCRAQWVALLAPVALASRLGTRHISMGRRHTNAYVLEDCFLQRSC